MNVQLIYTTNYDQIIERAFKLKKRDCYTVANIDDIATAPIGATRVVKFHGTFSADESLVLTESSYFNRLEFESAIDIQLRADTLGQAEEATTFFEQTDVKDTYNISFHVIKRIVEEILDPDLNFVVRKKALEAYRYLNQPCLVEMSGLFFNGLPQLPGPLGRIIWKAVGERMCDFLRKEDTRLAIARSIVGYCDGKQIRLYEGSTAGEITERARGDYNKSNWDPIFIPEGDKQTYAEMGGERKYKTSPLIKAFRKFLEGFSDGARTQT
jgi:XTP/dITP diphosphohydrolase